MITEEAYKKLKLEVAAQHLGAGVLSESTHLYLTDYWSVSKENPSWSKKQIEQTLLRPTGVTSLVNRASENYTDGALATTKSHRMLSGFASGGLSILLGVIANIIFTLIMIAFFLSAQDISANFFRSLGFQVLPQSGKQENIKILPDAAGPAIALPSPTKPTVAPDDN